MNHHYFYVDIMDGEVMTALILKTLVYVAKKIQVGFVLQTFVRFKEEHIQYFITFTLQESLQKGIRKDYTI